MKLLTLCNRCIVFFILLLSVPISFAQTSTNTTQQNPVPEYVLNAQGARARQEQESRRIVERTRSATDNRSARKSETPEQKKARKLEKANILNQINDSLAAPPYYSEKYATFLKKKGTGITKIFSDRGCDNGLVVNVQDLERCSGSAQIKGAGSLYSFRLSNLPDHLPIEIVLEYIAQADIHYIDGMFKVGTKSILGIIADIGDVDLEQIKLRSDSVQYLRSFRPGKTVDKVVIQSRELAAGVSESGYFYSNAAPVVLGRTYVLRSIAFNYTEYRSFWNTDLLTAFKVVGQEDDGSVVILWKELDESSAPRLRFK